MSLRKVFHARWYCSVCNYSIIHLPVKWGTRCPACGHDDVLATHTEINYIISLDEFRAAKVIHERKDK